jgi:hypothetical protein
MIEAIDADDAWWPPTFTPDGVLRTLFAWWTIDVASHSTRRSTACSSSSPAWVGDAADIGDDCGFHRREMSTY